jgi:hypothetical protein
MYLGMINNHVFSQLNVHMSSSKMSYPQISDLF